MSGFIEKKIKIFRFEAARSNENSFLFFLKKAGRWVLKQVILFLDLLTLLVCIPFSLFIKYSAKKNKTRLAFFYGVDHVIDKIVLRGDYFKKQGYEVTYFSLEVSGLRSSHLNGKIIKFRKLLLLDVPVLFKQFSQKPGYVELYYEGNGVRQFFTRFLVNKGQTVVASVDRGVLEYDKHTNVNPLLFSFLKNKTYRFSNLLLVRDPDMYEFLKAKKGLDQTRKILDYNRALVKELDDAQYEKKQAQKPIRILFLNAFALERSPEILAQAIPLVICKHKDVEFVFVGARNEVERSRVMDIANELGVTNYLRLHDWDANAAKYFDESVIFILAAKFVFCNIALIEAMERGLAPIVSKVPKADWVITDGVNGLMYDNTKEGLADKINYLIEHAQERIRLGKAARNTIIEKFNNDSRMNVVEEEIRSLDNKLRSTEMVVSA